MEYTVHPIGMASAPEDPSILSGVAHNKAELGLLSKGLFFCPIPPRLNMEAVRDDLDRYFRHAFGGGRRGS